MKIKLEAPEKKYPYLAVWIGKDTVLSEHEIRHIAIKDILVLSFINNEELGIMQVYVTTLNGDRESYFTTHESDYFPLPMGFTITLTQ